jgi:hypothetical protein
MPHWSRIRLGNRFEVVGFSLVGPFRQLASIHNVLANVPAFPLGAAVPCAEGSLTALSFGQDEYQRHRIPHYGREWMAWEDQCESRVRGEESVRVTA